MKGFTRTLLDHRLLPAFVDSGLGWAFAVSVMTNLFFGPQMMFFHRLEDNLIDRKWNMAGLTTAWWTLLWFWIPAHTVTFSLQTEYQIGLAAVWSLVLGLIMGFTPKGKPRGGNDVGRNTHFPLVRVDQGLPASLRSAACGGGSMNIMFCWPPAACRFRSSCVSFRFLLVIFSVMGMLLARPTIAGEIDSIIGRVIPYPEYADQVRTFVANRVEEFWVYRRLAGWVGSLGLLFAASGLFSSMRTVLDTVFEIPGKRSAIIAKLHDIGLVLMVMVFFLLSTIILPAFEVRRPAGANLDGVAGVRPGIDRRHHVYAVLSFLVIWFGFYMIYVTVPHRRPPHWVLVISSFTAAVLWQVAQVVFGYYIRQFVTFKQIYGTYSFLLVAALWLYYTSVIFILGAEIGRLSDEWKHRAKPEAASGAG